MYATEASAYARGILIWVKPGVTLEELEVKVDKEGRWVFVRGELKDQEITLGNIYAPNQGQLEFF